MTTELVDDATLRRCPLCGQDKPLSLFARDRSKKHGRAYRCKACDQARMAERWSNPSDRDSQRNREYHQSPQRAEYERARASTPEVKARRALRNAVRSGVVIRPSICDGCGIGDTEVHAHHHDYGKPLDVVWLCSACHADQHRKVWK